MKKLIYGSMVGLLALGLLSACSQKEKKEETKQSAAVETPAKKGTPLKHRTTMMWITG